MFRVLLSLLGIFFGIGILTAAPDDSVPASLKPWQPWVLRHEPAAHSPPEYSDAARKLSLWPSALQLEAMAAGGSFSMEVQVYDPAWLALPGGSGAWPQEVTTDSVETPVLDREGRPSLFLPAGRHTVAGKFRWNGIPEKLPVPPEIGILRLSVEGRPVEIPDWEPDGTLWLKRTRAEAAEEDFLSLQVYRVIEDGIPVFLQTELELSAAGKSREELLGTALPEGWLISSIDSPLPCTVDDTGRLKVQVRAGKWQIRFTAFRTGPPESFRYAGGAPPLSESELIALRAAPSLRLIELRGIPAIDVSQTTFPEKWRQLPVHLWETKEPFQIEEKMRGLGDARPPGLAILRLFWLDESGRHVTYQDRLTGSSQRTWRLDVAPQNDLGAVKIGGEDQLITLNPLTGAHGVEVRSRELSLEATGRAPFTGQVAATGWNTGAERLNNTLELPPGWRLFAVFGPEWSEGDWLTSWSLLDVFLVLVFSLSVHRLRGLAAGLTALLVMLLCWHEPGAPRWSWFALVAVLALASAVPKESRLRRWTCAAIALTLIWLGAVTVPFVSRQVTGMLFPQAETIRQSPRLFSNLGITKYSNIMAQSARPRNSDYAMLVEDGAQETKAAIKSNLIYEKTARIQTGPALPSWNWRTATFGWNGPVNASQTFHPVLLPPWVQRVLVAVRLALIAGLLLLLLRRKGGNDPAKSSPPPPVPVPPVTSGATAVLLVIAGIVFLNSPARAQEEVSAPGSPAEAPAPGSAAFPSPELLNDLRTELLKPADAFPGAAEIPHAKLILTDRELTMELVVHTAALTAVPLPGRLPGWSPLSVDWNGQPAPAVARRDGGLWIALPPGAHRVKVRGLLPSATEWQWAFTLKPRQVEIEAPGWTVTGVQPGGVPEGQVFFARQQSATDAGAAYDRRDFNAVAAVDRHLELGLVWQVRTTVTRLSSNGKAMAFSLPLLPGERVLTGGITPSGDRLEVRLGAGENSSSWESEIPAQSVLTLNAETTDQWVERWKLEASPVWNIGLTGLMPVFDADGGRLIPAWYPWPGESAALTVTRPEPVTGETVTVKSAQHSMSLSAQRRSVTLTLDIEASVGRDFPVTLPATAEVNSLSVGGQNAPVRREGGQVILPVKPGEQTLVLDWTESTPLTFSSPAGAVTLPVECANITTRMAVAENRWTLWANGPLRGPAVRFWAVLLAALLIAQVLGRLPLSPLNRLQWTLLLPGLTQVPLIAGGGFVLWLFWLAWRGRHHRKIRPPWFQLNQLILTFGAFCAALVLIAVVHTGLLGRPTMFILGEGSYRNSLVWYQDRTGGDLPVPSVISVSVWVYRGLMLAWCLWLAFTLLRLVHWAWQQFSAGGLWHPAAVPRDPLPPDPW